LLVGGSVAFAVKPISPALSRPSSQTPVKQSASAREDPLEYKFQLAQSLARKKKVKEAIAVVNSILQDRPGDQRALMWRGQAYLKDDREFRAIEDFSEVLKQNPNKFLALIYRAKAYVFTKQFQKAINDCNRILETSPRDRAALYWRGVSLAYTYNMEEGLRDLELANSIRPHSQIYFTSGAAYVNLCRLEDAIKAYTKTLAMNPRHSLAYMTRGRCYYNLKNYQKAIRDYALGTENNKGYWRVHLYLAQAYEKIGERDKASRELELASVNEPELAEGYYSSSVEDAIEAVEKSGAARGGAEVDAFVAEALKLREKKDDEGALRALNKALELDPADHAAHLQRGRLRMDKHDWDAALADFLWIVHAGDRDSEGVSRMCVTALLAKKDYKRAVYACNGAMFWDEYWLAGYFYKAQALEGLMKREEAKSFYKQFLVMLKNPKAVKESGASKAELASWEKIARSKV
jgi:tetratricopeptide (TPR) repeat protein